MKTKNVLALILALILAAGCMAVPAYAAGQEGSTPDNPVKMDYHDIDTSVYSGAWVSTGLGFDVYLPEDWVIVELTKEQKDAGLAFQAGENGGGANMSVTLTPTPAGYGYEQLGQELAASATTAMYADLNGLPAVIFENDNTKVTGYSMLTGDNGLITGVMSAPSDDQYDAYAPWLKNMLLSVSPSTPELNWETYEADAKEVDPDGAFVTLQEVGIKLWVSAILREMELTAEDKKDGCVAYFADAAEETGLAVYYYDDLTMDEYYKEIEGYSNCSGLEKGLVNGYKAFTYDNTEYDTTSVVISAGKDCMEFSFWPASDKNFSILATYMAASIQEA